MRREELRAGNLYRDSRGRKIEIVDNSPGWKVVDGTWMRQPNGRCIRILLVGGMEAAKGAIDPRNVVEEWDKWRAEELERAAERDYARDSVSRAQRAIQDAGHRPELFVVTREGKITISWRDLDVLLGLASERYAR